eukprot:TRINITY_DN19682_c0_g1_i1.p1 TRINITY_DN19682_c0_g1~~TRINITY_DN19682_c0_g1_i1.p1  ORF type:complete len:460 (-),score=53.96 TRINITY_DN19682_c0_g1_i1:115-1494(-)
MLRSLVGSEMCIRDSTNLEKDEMRAVFFELLVPIRIVYVHAYVKIILYDNGYSYTVHSLYSPLRQTLGLAPTFANTTHATLVGNQVTSVRDYVADCVKQTGEYPVVRSGRQFVDGVMSSHDAGFTGAEEDGLVTALFCPFHPTKKHTVRLFGVNRYEQMAQGNTTISSNVSTVYRYFDGLTDLTLLGLPTPAEEEQFIEARVLNTTGPIDPAYIHGVGGEYAGCSSIVDIDWGHKHMVVLSGNGTAYVSGIRNSVSDSPNWYDGRAFYGPAFTANGTDPVTNVTGPRTYYPYLNGSNILKAIWRPFGGSENDGAGNSTNAAFASRRVLSVAAGHFFTAFIASPSLSALRAVGSSTTHNLINSIVICGGYYFLNPTGTGQCYNLTALGGTWATANYTLLKGSVYALCASAPSSGPITTSSTMSPSPKGLLYSVLCAGSGNNAVNSAVSYTHLTLPTKRIV